MANAKPSTSRRRLAQASPQRANTRPVHTAATVPNSGPTTIAPTTSTEESVITATDARIVASTRNTW